MLAPCDYNTALSNVHKTKQHVTHTHTVTLFGQLQLSTQYITIPGDHAAATRILWTITGVYRSMYGESMD